MLSLLKKPSAWIPIIIPLLFLAYILPYIALNGMPTPDPNADEGVGAHLFQLWLLLEPFMLGFFAVKWFPHAPKQTSMILALQIIVALLPIVMVFSLQL
ncbi:MAG: hypothetical protein A2664_01880 [Candidatus Taylorbacteria bacterium RIFCSPHIGHO2_01_FULL_46_22b]|uniref:Uncharacterized protein n=1 Tax=Candidatus Taylorbacteria bacterium RIFCSPHIGHO2_01_FULL_46_22b TaxID=1802301 RepID=A0A1G2M2W3_9BACT|nr:MAG: hypothetical protein A2664_01880 [Candidatus Taylorbacteria bacterium RIFCSPHIGHO2_01_FULL_46_22b]